MTACCEAFQEQTVERYEGFEQLDDGTWAILGCCGGGCFVVEQMKFCPYCGTRLPDEKLKKEKLT